MDVPRTAPNRRWKHALLGAGALALLALGLVLARLKPAAPAAERSSLLIDTVQRGPMVFQVRGTGTLVPVDVRMITAQVPCNVERVLLFPGSAVREDSVIAELSSPELRQAVALGPDREAAAGAGTTTGATASAGGGGGLGLAELAGLAALLAAVSRLRASRRRAASPALRSPRRR